MKKRLEERVNTYGDYLKKRYGKRTFRIGLSLHQECPHRLDNGGCIFCLTESFTDLIQKEKPDPEKQLEILIPKLKKNCGDVKLLAYFQDNTSTSGNVQQLKQIFTKTLKHIEISGLIISTRPDFLNEEIMEMLKGLPGDVFLEIGLQSIHQKSLDLLNRGHNMTDFARAVKLSEEYKIETGVHLILGIPGETLNDILETISYLNSLDAVSQIKFHNLVVYEGTPLASYPQEFREAIPHLEDYIALIGNVLPHVRGNRVISRLFTSNVNRTNLTLNPFPGIKRDWLNRLTAYLNDNDIIQGSATDLIYERIN